jgi:AraC-like DNA-binding protein
MTKHVLPTYNINTLTGVTLSPKDFVGDHFAHYLDAHTGLRFPHKHSFYHFVYFTNGSGNHSIDFVNFPVHAGQVYFMVPGQVHSWDFEKKPDGYIVNFSEQYLHALIADPRYLDQFSFFSGIATEQVIDIPQDGRKQVCQLFETIISEGNSQKKMNDDFARAALLQLLILVSRYVPETNTQQPGQYNSLLMRNFRQLIEKNYKEKKLTKEYAAMLYVTPNHLNALSKDVTGLSAGELIRDRILLEAKRLLINAQINISQIAAELGFIDNSYFTKFFKKYVGFTPEIFRKQIIKN